MYMQPHTLTWIRGKIRGTGTISSNCFKLESIFSFYVRLNIAVEKTNSINW